MENLKQEIELLYKLQIYDIKIDEVRKQISKKLLLIEEKNKTLENKKTELRVRNKAILELNFLREEKATLLDLKERIIDKRSVELNTIKSSDIYGLMFIEIEKLKTDKGTIEDEIIELMDKIDKESFLIEAINFEFEKFKNKIESDISNFEKSMNELEIQAEEIKKEREEYKLKVDKSILMQYERLCEGCEGQGIAIVDGGSCGGCGMVLRPQLINQIQKSHNLVFCDNCSRILLIGNEIT